MLAPVVVFVYNRPEHTKKTLEELNKSPLASETDVYIYSDNAKKGIAINKVKEVRTYIEKLSLNNKFKSLHIIKAEKNKGLANSVINGITEVINDYGKVIVLEDDLITSSDFLSYMNNALNFYQYHEHIWSISGYTFSMDSLNNYPHDIFMGYRGGSGGWATWKDRWDTVDWDVSDYEKFRLNYKKRKRFNSGGNNMSHMLDAQMQGKIDSWAIRWCYQQSKLNMLTVYPKISKVVNIGLDGTGTHSGITNSFDTLIKHGESPCKFEILDLDRNISREFKKKFDVPLYIRIGLIIKQILVRIFVKRSRCISCVK